MNVSIDVCTNFASRGFSDTAPSVFNSLPLTFVLICHHTHSVVFLKPIVSSRPSVPPSGWHKVSQIRPLADTAHYKAFYLCTYFIYYIQVDAVQSAPAEEPVQVTSKKNNASDADNSDDADDDDDVQITKSDSNQSKFFFHRLLQTNLPSIHTMSVLGVCVWYTG